MAGSGAARQIKHPSVITGGGHKTHGALAMIKIEKSIKITIDGNDVNTLFSVCSLAKMTIDAKKDWRKGERSPDREQLAYNLGYSQPEFQEINAFLEKIFEET